MFARCPRSPGEVVFEPGVRELELLFGERETVAALRGIAGERSADGLLHPVHDVKVEEPIEEADVESGQRIGG